MNNQQKTVNFKLLTPYDTYGNDEVSNYGTI